MPSYRPDRVAEMVHREVSMRLRTEIKDPELVEISITRVEMTRDLGQATVFFLPFGGGEAPKPLREALGRVGRRLRGPVGRALRLRTAPEIVFELDVRHEAAVRMTHLLSTIGSELRAKESEE
jgi:ribosome-binding factor A